MEAGVSLPWRRWRLAAVFVASRQKIQALIAWQLAALALLLLTACAPGSVSLDGGSHLLPAAEKTPAPVPLPLLVTMPPPQSLSEQASGETYSVEVNRVPVHELLFALARDARLDIDIHPEVDGLVTLNAKRQTLAQLMQRLSRLLDLRYRFDGASLLVEPDTPFLRNYALDYPLLMRETTASLAVATQLLGVPALADGSSGGGSGNNSLTRIESRSKHSFWETLVQNVKDILRETDKILPEGSSETVVEEAALRQVRGNPALATKNAAAASKGAAATKAVAKDGAGAAALAEGAAAVQNSGTTVVRRSSFREAASVIAHPESGVLAVRASARQHERIGAFLDRVQAAAQRQVLIEATLVEVQLADAYQQGVDWNRLASRAGFGFSRSSSAESGNGGDGSFSISYTSQNFSAVLRLLETFGTTRVLSSPKLAVLNNQTAVLKVVDNSVYFTVKADTAQNQTTTVTTYTSTPNQVPVGLVMSVTPQISDSDSVLLSVRPSVSRIVATVRDPNPALRKGVGNVFAEDIVSEIPVIRTREMESLLRVQDGNIAVMGGLMEDSVRRRTSSVPGAGRLGFLGEAFTQRSDQREKNELVVFIRPSIIRDPEVSGDYAGLFSADAWEAGAAAAERRMRWGEPQ